MKIDTLSPDTLYDTLLEEIISSVIKEIFSQLQSMFPISYFCDFKYPSLNLFIRQNTIFTPHNITFVGKNSNKFHKLFKSAKSKNHISFKLNSLHKVINKVSLLPVFFQCLFLKYSQSNIIPDSV